MGKKFFDPVTATIFEKGLLGFFELYGGSGKIYKMMIDCRNREAIQQVCDRMLVDVVFYWRHDDSQEKWLMATVVV